MVMVITNGNGYGCDMLMCGLVKAQLYVVYMLLVYGISQFLQHCFFIKAALVAICDCLQYVYFQYFRLFLMLLF